MTVPSRPIARFVAIATLAATVGCQAPGVGDPCEPESAPTGGFLSRESYLETSSVQCSTRVCMVYQLDGLPNRDGACAAPHCASPHETENRVYCTCRCAGPGDGHCACPRGFACAELFSGQTVPQGIQGSYCVKTPTVAP